MPLLHSVLPSSTNMGISNAKPSAPGQRVLVAVDESQVSADTLKWAAKHVINPNDKLVLVTVVDNALRQQLTTGAGRSVPNVTEKCEADPETLAYSQKFLAKIRDDVLVKEGVKPDQVETSTLVSCVGSSNDIGKVISEYAAEAKADSVVVGARGLGAFKRSVLGLLGMGSVSQYVVNHAPCSVIVHKMDH